MTRSSASWRRRSRRTGSCSRSWCGRSRRASSRSDAVKADLERDGGAVSRELLMGVARQEDPLAALALWRRLQLGVLSVRRFREEKAGRRRERAAVAEVLALARRMNRALARLLADELPANETPRVSRALRRTRRLIDRQLDATSPPSGPSPS